MTTAVWKYRRSISGLLQEGSSIPIVIPLSPIIRKFHVETIKNYINHSPLLVMNDPTCRAVIAAIYCLNILNVYEDSLVIFLCSNDENREMFLSLLLEFGVEPSQIYVELKSSGKNVKVIKKGVVFMTANAFTHVNETFKTADLKLLVIDEAEKAHSNSAHSKCVRNAIKIQKNFRTLGLCNNIEMKKSAIVQSVISNLSITKVFVQDHGDNKFMDAVLEDEIDHLTAQFTLHFTVLTQLFALGMKPYIKRLELVSLFNETDPLYLIYGQLDEWKSKAINTPFKDEAEIMHSLLKAYKHLIFSGSHSFFLYLQAMQAKFPALKETIEHSKHLKTVYKHLEDVYSKLDQETDREKKIQSFKHLNPKYVPLAECLDSFNRSGKNAVLVAWSPFAVKSLTQFSKLVFPDKKVFTSLYSDLEEEKEYKLTDSLNPNYSCFEGFDIDIMTKTLHIDKKSKRVFKHVVAMDSISASLYRIQIGTYKTIIAMKSYEAIPHRFFAKNPFLENVKYIFHEGAFRMVTPIGKFHKFDADSFPHETAFKLSLKKREDLLVHVQRNMGKVMTANDSATRPSKVTRKRKAKEDE